MNLSGLGLVSIFACLCSGLATADAKLAKGSALDIQGRRHVCEVGPPGTIPPWLADRVVAIGPEYPVNDRARRHEGRGMFRIILDAKTGRVVEVTVINSTGFRSLDESAIAALRKWRWKPGRWKEIALGVSFEIKK